MIVGRLWRNIFEDYSRDIDSSGRDFNDRILCEFMTERALKNTSVDIKCVLMTRVDFSL